MRSSVPSSVGRPGSGVPRVREVERRARRPHRPPSQERHTGAPGTAAACGMPPRPRNRSSPLAVHTRGAPGSSGTPHRIERSKRASEGRHVAAECDRGAAPSSRGGRAGALGRTPGQRANDEENGEPQQRDDHDRQELPQDWIVVLRGVMGGRPSPEAVGSRDPLGERVQPPRTPRLGMTPRRGSPRESARGTHRTQPN